MKFSEMDTTKLGENVSEETLKHCKRILSRYDNLDSESKILARQSFINAILNDPNIEKKMNEVAENTLRMYIAT